MKKIELEIVAISHSVSSTHSYAVVLGEQEGPRRLPIVIGPMEAQAIAVAMEGIKPGRPLTHDLLKNILTTFDVELKEVIISNLLDGIFYARLICLKTGGEIIEIDSRTSDALAMAVRFECPIYTFETILDAAGIILEGSEASEKPTTSQKSGKHKGYHELTIEQLEQKLSEALEKENYEDAAQIRDEIKTRKEDT